MKTKINVLATPGRNSNCCCDDGHLLTRDYQEFLHVLVSDDVETLRGVLKQMSSEKKAALYKGHFKYNDTDADIHKSSSDSAQPDTKYRVSLPLAMAVAVRAHRVVAFLLDGGELDPLLGADCHGNNVLHALSVLLEFRPDLEEHAVSTLQMLTKKLSVETMKRLLHAENGAGLRPVEYAAQHGLCSLVLQMMETPGVYLYKRELKGVTWLKSYDITDYESLSGEGCRADKSPLMLLTYMDAKRVEVASFARFAESELIQKWQQHKFLVALPLILLWMAFRFVFYVGYLGFELDMSEYNTTNASACFPQDSIFLSLYARSTIITFLMIVSSITVIVDVIETAMMFSRKQWPIWNSVRGRKNLLCQVHFYRYVHALFSFTTLISAIGSVSVIPLPLLVDFVRVISPLMGMASLFYFIQLLPSIGTFIMCIVQMTQQLVNFLVILALLLIPFTQSFYKFINVNTDEGCIADFNGMVRTFYSVFTMTLNMVSIADLRLDRPTFMYVNHALFTFTVGIMLVNFFIAIMAGSVSALLRYHRASLTMQRATVAWQVERRCRWLLARYFRHMNRRWLATEQGRVLIRVSALHDRELEPGTVQ